MASMHPAVRGKRAAPSDLVHELRRQRLEAAEVIAAPVPLFVGLPTDIIVSIMLKVGAPTLLMLAITCKRLNKVYRDTVARDAEQKRICLEKKEEFTRQCLVAPGRLRVATECLLSHNAYEDILLRMFSHCNLCEQKMKDLMNSTFALWESIGALGMRRVVTHLQRNGWLQALIVDHIRRGALSSGHVDILPLGAPATSADIVTYAPYACRSHKSTLYMLSLGCGAHSLLASTKWPIGKGVFSLLVSRLGRIGNISLTDLPRQLFHIEHCYSTLRILLSNGRYWEWISLAQHVVRSRCPKALKYLFTYYAHSTHQRALFGGLVEDLRHVDFDDHLQVADTFRPYKGDIEGLVLEAIYSCRSVKILAGLCLAATRKNRDFICPTHNLSGSSLWDFGADRLRREYTVDTLQGILLEVNRIVQREVFTTVNLSYILAGKKYSDEEISNSSSSEESTDSSESEMVVSDVEG